MSNYNTPTLMNTRAEDEPGLTLVNTDAQDPFEAFIECERPVEVRR